MRSGYYPFGSDADFDKELRQVITRALEQDIPSYAQMTMATGRKLLELMVVVSELMPFKPNMSNLANPYILFNLCEECNAGTVRETFFLNQMRVNQLVASSKVSDFKINGRTFEVGGPGERQSQIRDVDDGYVVKDGIEYGFGNVVPFWAFGLNY